MSNTYSHQDKNQDDKSMSPLLIKKNIDRSGHSVHSSSISLSPNHFVIHEINHLNDINDINDTNDMNEIYIKDENSNKFVYHTLKQSVNFLMENISDSWKSKWSLKFDSKKLEDYFKVYFGHRYLLQNQVSFLLFSLFYIIMLFIFELQNKYEWISVAIHCILIIIIFITLILSFTDQFKIYIHRLTAIILFTILIGLDIQACLAEIPISPQSILTIILVLFASSSFLSLRYNHLIILYLLFFIITNLIFIADLFIKSTKLSYWIWFNMLLLFGMICSLHLIRLFEMQQRKLFLRVLHEMKQTKNTLKRQLTLYETISIAQLIENDRCGYNKNDYMLDKVLKQFIKMGGLFQHLPDIEVDDDVDDEDDEDIDDDINDENNAPIVQDDNKPTIKKPTLCKLKELPDYYNGYPFINIGYRLNYDYKKAILSIFSWHNETINIWTEIIPLILNIFCLSFFISNDSLWSILKIDDKTLIIIGGFLVLIFRPICSVLAHTFYLISKKAHDFWWRVDYISICITMLFEGIISGNYTFNCNYQLKLLFFTCVSCMFISTMLSTLVSKSMQIRAALFCLFVIFATGCPFLYQWIMYYSNYSQNNNNKPLIKYLTLWTFAYILAAFALIIKSLWFPERCCKKQRKCLSYFGASHQIWHILINSCLSLSVYAWIVYLRFKYEGKFNCS